LHQIFSLNLDIIIFFILFLFCTVTSSLIPNDLAKTCHIYARPSWAIGGSDWSSNKY
jgi:hypothetical protein